LKNQRNYVIKLKVEAAKQIKVTRLSDMKEAHVVDPKVGKPHRFVVGTVSDGKESKVVVRSNNVSCHVDALGLFLRDEINPEPKFTLRPSGGGGLYLSDKDKTIWTWGLSFELGPPDHKKVKELLLRGYPGFKVTIIPELKEGATKSIIFDCIGRANVKNFAACVASIGVNNKIVDGKTTMHMAIEMGALDHVGILKSLNARIDIPDNNGDTAKKIVNSYAKKFRAVYLEMQALLRSH
jgi:hypothetical protein